jgi:hypothetical protein
MAYFQLPKSNKTNHFPSSSDLHPHLLQPVVNLVSHQLNHLNQRAIPLNRLMMPLFHIRCFPPVRSHLVYY